MEAIEIAQRIGWPVVLKLHSEIITHKSDVDGVKLNLQDVAAVKRAYAEIEKSARAHTDPHAFLGVTCAAHDPVGRL